MSKLAKREGIKVEGHKGTWYVVDEAVYEGRQMYMLEHETYGDGVAWIIVDSDLNIVLEDVYDGWSDLEEAIDCDYLNE